ncbi:MAG: sarcosine oxidase subunit gamma [Roseobacter sp.]
MHDLAPLTPLGSAKPERIKIGAVTISENPALGLASVAARLGHEAAVTKTLHGLLGAAPPAPSKATLNEPMSAVWIGPNQWLIIAPFETHEDLASTLAIKLAGTASVTEQSDGWATFDLSGPTVVELLERLCAAPARRMSHGDAQRSVIHHMGCFVICEKEQHRFRVMGPRSSAGSLHHAVLTAAHAVS